MEQAPARRVRMIAVGLSAAAALAWIAPAQPVVAQTQAVVPAAPFSVRGAILAVASASARSAWAVGQTGSLAGPKPKTLIARWDGTAWTQMPSPTPASGGLLDGVAATSARSAWAVGQTGEFGSPHPKTLILRWDDTAWTRFASPTPAGGGVLLAVAVTSGRNAFAVGYTSRGLKTLILRWDGTAWSKVASPSPGHRAILTGVAATSAASAWAVGATGTKTLILHWDGASWAKVPSPITPAGGALLNEVAVTSPRNAWAVGCIACFSHKPRTLILRWNGTAWTRSITPSGVAILNDVAATSPRRGWAVGQTGSIFTQNPKTLILRWNGSAWTRVPSPTPAGGAILYFVAAASARSLWAVGQTGSFSSPEPKTLVLRWTGTAWK